MQMIFRNSDKLSINEHKLVLTWFCYYISTPVLASWEYKENTFKGLKFYQESELGWFTKQKMSNLNDLLIEGTELSWFEVDC